MQRSFRGGPVLESWSRHNFEIPVLLNGDLFRLFWKTVFLPRVKSKGFLDIIAYDAPNGIHR